MPTFELNGIDVAANANFVLRGDAEVLALAKSVVRRAHRYVNARSASGRG